VVRGVTERTLKGRKGCQKGDPTWESLSTPGREERDARERQSQPFAIYGQFPLAANNIFKGKGTEGGRNAKASIARLIAG